MIFKEASVRLSSDFSTKQQKPEDIGIQRNLLCGEGGNIDKTSATNTVP
jgi:hypothetical protein